MKYFTASPKENQTANIFGSQNSVLRVMQASFPVIHKVGNVGILVFL